jgi:23S rRNA U2552 (ribose-2'-O)-methylase RlmE/FtsJ
MYKLFILDLPKTDISKFSNTNLVSFSDNINQPLIELGFQVFLHRTKNAMEITTKLESKDKFYYVISLFEHLIKSYKDDIKSATLKYLKAEKEPPVLSRAFYKMWEIIYIFDLVKENMNVAGLAEGPGAFIQAVIKYKENLGMNLKKDNFYGITLHTEDKLDMNTTFLKFNQKKYPKLLQVFKTSKKNDGDITKMENLDAFEKFVGKNKADLVTADGGFDWKNENYQEQEAYKLIIGEMIGALKIQKKGGNFVLKIFETFTIVSLKLIYFLTSFYEENHIIKPYFSRESNSEKYIVCKNFKDTNKDKIKLLENILNTSNKTDKFIKEIFLDIKLPANFIDKFKYTNINISNNQQIQINKIVTYIKGNNFFGDDYHAYLDKQIAASKWWIETFFPEKKNLSKKQKELQSSLNKIKDDNNQDLINFTQNLVVS